MDDPTPFVVRPLQSTGLDGAFRVHLSPDSLERLGLKVGELCQITGENGTTGCGIAWRATEKVQCHMGTSPKVRPAKMTDTLKTAFAFKEGSHVTISKTSTQILHADKITLHDVTPTDLNSAAEMEDRRWEGRTKCLLNESEAVAIGITIEVFKKRGSKKRYFIDHIETKAKLQPGMPALFEVDDTTQLVISEPNQHVLQNLTNGTATLPILDNSCIGGLLEEVQELNRRLDRILHNTSHSTMGGRGFNTHILLHGYEGTGKTLILDTIEQRASMAFKVIRLHVRELASTSNAKIIAKLDSAFQEAMAAANQPCLILLDNITKSVPSDNDACVEALGDALDKIRGSRVLAIATVRSITAVSSSLTATGRFSAVIELPIPDRAARYAILATLLGPLADGETVTRLAQRTHAFTGKDLDRLVETAADHQHLRQDVDREEWVQVHARASIYASVSGQLDGSVHSQATTEVDTATQRLARDAAPPDADPLPLLPSWEDFEYAFKKVGPTALREVFLEMPSVHWSDIGGSDAMKQRFDEIISWPLKHADILERDRKKPQKGVLLYGPPGCSKTLTAQAVATTYELNFMAVKGAELISMYVGESERAVREVFRKAKQAAPCIIFFDEIDAIGSERDSQKGLHVLTTLLNEMDGFEAMENVLVLAATNKPESLDPALIRAGRFDSHVYIGPPETPARRDIFNICLNGITKVERVDLEELARVTQGYSGAEIVGIVEEAKNSSIRRQIAGEGAWSQDDFLRAVQQTPKSITEKMLAGYAAFANRE